jgi:hypothetical protein
MANGEPWKIVLPGPPPTINHSYKIVTVPARDGRGLVRRLGKADGVESYQAGVTLITKAAKPSGWTPTDKIRLRYWFHLARDLDCDNALKAIDDAIALAIRPDASPAKRDAGFLPCVVDVVTDKENPRVIVELENIE